MIKKGKLIVIEGTDGSGKGTQIKPLAEYLKKQGQKVEIIDFPQYADNMWGQMVGQFLKGDFGDIDALPPKYAALPYMLDRLVAKPKIEKWLSQGKVVLSNRYMTSNLAFMGAKAKDKRDETIEWLKQAEYETNKLPQPDLVVLLNVTPELSHSMVAKKEERDYMKGSKNVRDIFEDNVAFQTQVAGVYMHLAKTEKNWKVIDCLNGKDMKPIPEITEELINALKEKKIIK
jgi:dTMP kinase